MDRILSAIVVGLITCSFVASQNINGGGPAKADEKIINNEKNGSDSSRPQTALIITVMANGDITVFELNVSPAAKDLYSQLPLSVTVENFASNEKIFYPPEKLSTTDTPIADGGQAGTLAYYAPWGNVVMFYGGFSPAQGLFELGHVKSGREHIQKMTGTIKIIKGVIE
jgi:hypothetical protein